MARVVPVKDQLIPINIAIPLQNRSDSTPKMSDQTTPSTTTTPSIDDAYEYLQIFPNPDGTITRKPSRFPNILPTPDPSHPTPVLSKDIPINQSKGTWARIYLPRQALDHNSSFFSSSIKLPLLVYIHGGGFILLSAATKICHDFCINIAVDLPAVVVSVDYRLAPEHRLPAAYDDTMEAFHWIKTTQESWLREYADYTSCFIMGSSAGGNIAYHVALRMANHNQVHDPLPLTIRGLILHQPFFGGTQRTSSEFRLINDLVLPLGANDLMWDLSLPVGVDRNHEYANPTVGGGSRLLDQIKLMGWRVLVTGCGGDPLLDRQIEFVKLMEEKGLKVESHFREEGYHGVEIIEPSKGKAFFVALKKFIVAPN